MKYAHILSYVTDTLWAILPSKLEAITVMLAARSNGVEATPEQLAAFAGRESPQPSARGNVAILPMRGVLAHRAGMLEESSGGVSTESFGKAFKALMADPNVSAIVLDVDSPGGAVAGIHELAQDMLALKGTKKVVAVANSTMASAAYWLAAAAADEIVAMPSATVGSIGVAAVRVDDTKQREAQGIALDVFTSGENKAEALGVGPLSEEGRARMQARVNEAGAWFRADVAKGRGITSAQVKANYGEGMVFGAKDAKAAGLIDRIDTLEGTIARLAGKASSRAALRAEADYEAAVAIADENPNLTVDECLAAAHGVGDIIHGKNDETPVGFINATEADRRRRLERF